MVEIIVVASLDIVKIIVLLHVLNLPAGQLNDRVEQNLVVGNVEIVAGGILQVVEIDLVGEGDTPCFDFWEVDVGGVAITLVIFCLSTELLTKLHLLEDTLMIVHHHEFRIHETILVTIVVWVEDTEDVSSD